MAPTGSVVSNLNRLFYIDPKANVNTLTLTIHTFAQFEINKI